MLKCDAFCRLSRETDPVLCKSVMPHHQRTAFDLTAQELLGLCWLNLFSGFDQPLTNWRTYAIRKREVQVRTTRKKAKHD